MDGDSLLTCTSCGATSAPVETHDGLVDHAIGRTCERCGGVMQRGVAYEGDRLGGQRAQDGAQDSDAGEARSAGGIEAAGSGSAEVIGTVDLEASNDAGPLPTAADVEGQVAEALPSEQRLHLLRGGGGAAHVPTPNIAHLSELPAVPPGHCPACLAERTPTAEACTRCGLDFLRVDPAQLAPSDRLARDWSRLRQEWESPGAHRRYLERAQATGELSAAGRLYRIHLLHHPEDVQASAALDGMVQRALAAGLPRRSRADGDEAERRRRLNRLLQFLFVLLVGLGLLLLMLR